MNRFSVISVAWMATFSLALTGTTSAQPSRAAATVTMYEDDNGWTGRGDKWIVAIGEYSNKGRGGYKRLPVPNDEVRAVDVPAGLKVYMTDDDSFLSGRHGTVAIQGPKRVNIKDLNRNLAGKVSSIRVERVAPTTMPTTVPTHDYEVSIHTGAQPDAGTVDNIYVTLKGTKGQSPEYSCGNNFRPRDAKNLTLKLQQDIGVVQEVKIRSDYKRKDAWWLHYIAVTSPGAGGDTFDYGSWIKSTKVVTLTIRGPK